MKLLISLFVLSALTLSFNSVRAENADANAATFKKCVETEPGWYDRWGQYLAGYTYNSAQHYCSYKIWWSNYNVNSMGCSLDGKWKTAGYYCDEINGGE
ncbi:MAG: hypothetical protein IPM57_03095 [Oligoflexia bacterium]|nr:hypothetical protein [Oligoflexia bacterium]